MLLVYAVTCFLLVLTLLYYYLTRKFDYWTQRNVCGPKPTVLVGNMAGFFLRKEGMAQVINKNYSKHPNEKYVGIFNGRKPVFIPRDLDIVKQILIKDFDHFTDRGLAVPNDPLANNLFNSDGDTWRILRQNLTPVFSSGKLKNMFYLINGCGTEFQKYVGELADKESEPEIRGLMGKYTLGVIGSCAFGIDVNTFNDEENVFRTIGNNIFVPTFKQFLYRMLEHFIPGFLKTFNLSVAKPELVAFFDDLVSRITSERKGKASLRHDFMDLLLALREQGNISSTKFKDDRLINLEITDRVMAAQAFVFFAAGFETSSGAMSFLLHELALNPNIQEKLHKEIDDILKKTNGTLTYEAINEMHYLDMVLSEALRKYPVGEILVRKCVKQYKLPETNMSLDVGVNIMIPVMGIHMDPQYYPDPEKFDPERFSPENRSGRHASAYMPFGDGPRNCVGARFAKVQSMVGIAKFLEQFKVEPSSRTKEKLTFSPKTFTLTSADGIWLNIKRR